MSKLAHSNDETMAQIEANARADDRDEFTGHGDRCRGGAADCTCSPDYLASMADVAESLEESIAKNCPGWHPADSPVEIVVDLVNQRDELKAELEQLRLDFDKACARVTEIETALRPFANARTKEGWFGSIPDSQAYVAARLALGLPWEPRIPQPATISTDN